MKRILIVDDEPRLTSFVSRALTAKGFVVDTAADGRRGLELARSGQYDLVVLDLMLPGLDGISVLRATMEAHPHQPVLVLSAVSDSKARIRCLEFGASDYLTKPFELAELLLRIRARVRQPRPALPNRVLRAGQITLDVERRLVDAGAGPVHLSEREFRLLQCLMESRGSVCARGELLADVWGYSFDPRTNLVDVYISRLRAKLGAEAIVTVRNVGYCLQTA